MSRTIARWAACLATLAATCAAAERGITDTADASYDKASGITTLTIRITKNDAGFSLTTRWRAKPFDAVASHQKTSGWKGNYFFVRDDCLASNSDNAPWRCVREHVFTLLDDGNRLAYVGAVYAGEDCIEEQKFGCSLYQDVFTDIYDALEKNPLASHEDSPAPLIELRAKDGAFVADLDETWKANQERYRAGAKCLAATEEERKAACADGINPLRALLFNLALMRYTRHDDAYTEIYKQYRHEQCAPINSVDCKPALKNLDAFEQRIAAIPPGDLPKRAEQVKAISAQP